MIFLGAGASAPFDINTSSELTKNIQDKIDSLNPELRQKVDSFYSSSLGFSPDFETYLTQFNALTDPSRINPTHHSIIFCNQNKDMQKNMMI